MSRLKLGQVVPHIPSAYTFEKRPHIPVRGHENDVDVNRRFGGKRNWLGFTRCGRDPHSDLALGPSRDSMTLVSLKAGVHQGNF